MASFQASPPSHRIFFRPTLPVFLTGAGLSLLLTGCDDGPRPRILEARIEDLEKKLQVIENRTDTAMVTAETATQSVEHRIEAAEQQGKEAITQISSLVTDNEGRFQRLEKSISDVMRIKEESESVAYLDPTTQGHRTLQTDHGTFLVRLRGVERATTGGYVATLSIGNPMGLEVQSFRLKGDFGQPAPKLNPGEAYSDFSKRLDEWQKTLTPYEEALTESITPNAWSDITLPLAANSQDDLRLIRMAMVVERARLASSGEDGEYSVINADSDGAGLVKTDYGPLLMTVTGMAPEGAGTRVNVMVGNPFGFVINEGIIKGQFGPAPPQKMETETPQLYQKRLQLWSEQMEDFQTRIVGSISPLRWSQGSFLMPTSDASRIKYIRMQLNVSNLTLPKSGPPPP